MGEDGKGLTLSLSRVALAVSHERERERMISAAHAYYSRFDNVFTGPGIVDRGMIRPLPRTQTIEELGGSLLVATPAELVDRLGLYADAGIDRVILNMNFGAGQAATLDSIAMFAEDIMPHFTERKPDEATRRPPVREGGRAG